MHWVWYHQQRGRQDSRVYPKDLETIGELGLWLSNQVREELASDVVVNDNLASKTFPSSRFAMIFPSIKLHGYHYRMADENGNNKKTCKL